MDLAQFVLAHEPAIRLSFCGGIFAIVALWEWAAPRRALTVSKALRWSSNLGLVMLDAVLLRLHRVHHAERDDDLTTGVRFHPIETQPRAGHEAIVIGIRGHADLCEVARLDGMLLMPFRRQVDGYTINRRRWSGERDA